MSSLCHKENIAKIYIPNSILVKYIAAFTNILQFQMREAYKAGAWGITWSHPCNCESSLIKTFLRKPRIFECISTFLHRVEVWKTKKEIAHKRKGDGKPGIELRRQQMSNEG